MAFFSKTRGLKAVAFLDNYMEDSYLILEKMNTVHITTSSKASKHKFLFFPVKDINCYIVQACPFHGRANPAGL